MNKGMKRRAMHIYYVFLFLCAVLAGGSLGYVVYLFWRDFPLVLFCIAVATVCALGYVFWGFWNWKKDEL